MQPVTLRDFLNYRLLADLKASPDKGALSFVTALPNEAQNRYDNTLWVCALPDGQPRELCPIGPDRVTLWEDGETLLFSDKRDEDIKQKIKAGEEWTVFYRQKAAGGEPSEAFRLPYRVLKLLPLGAGRYAALVRYTYGRSGLGELPESERAARLAQLEGERDYDVFDELPFWFNGKGIVNGVRDRLLLFDSASGAVSPISEEYATVEGVCLQEGSLLYFANTYRDKKDATNALWSYSPGQPPQKLLEQGHYNVQYACRLSGKVMFLGSDMSRFGVNENPTFFELENGIPKPLYRYDLSAKSSVGSDCRLGEGVCFAVADDALWFLSTGDNYTAICRYTVAGNVERVYADRGSIDEFALGGDGAVYFIGLRNGGLPSVQRLQEGRETTFAPVNAAVEAERALSPVEKITFSLHGEQFEGFVVLPVGYDPQKRYPGILTIHGGPKSAYGGVFYHEFQFWAAQGYFVFYTNPTGSDGRGDEFADIVGKQGTTDYDELMTFVDTVLARYPALDAGRLGVTGGSYGGFMTNWIIGHTDRFAAAIAQCSISNWTSKLMTTDIGYYFNITQLGATPWSDPEKLWFHSPLKYADKVKTPTLFVQGQEDYRCWLTEPLQMFSALRYHGVESRVVVFHGENHAMVRGKPVHRIRRLTEIIGWFDKYLKAE